MAEDSQWWLYVLLCDGGRLYTGIAKDVQARFKQHQSGRGAFFTKVNRPVCVLAKEQHPSHSAALKAEYALKRLKVEMKWEWVRVRQIAPIPTIDGI